MFATISYKSILHELVINYQVGQVNLTSNYTVYFRFGGE